MPIASPVTAISRRSALAAAAGIVAGPALAQECHVGPPPHEKGPRVFLDYDQVELDAAYDQRFYAPLVQQIIRRYASMSEAVRERLGAPLRRSYGASATEMADIYRTSGTKAPIFVFIHGGAWLGGEAKNYAF